MNFVGVIIHPCGNYNSGLTKPPLKLYLMDVSLYFTNKDDYLTVQWSQIIYVYKRRRMNIDI